MHAALHGAGLNKRNLVSSVTGVFVGIQVGEFNTLAYRPEPGAYTATGGSAAIASNRVSYVLGLQGPSVSVDTACSSALVALEAAGNSLYSGSSSTAVSASANVLLSPAGFIGTCKAHMLSPRGRCLTFDMSADGYVRAEGSCALVLQTSNCINAVQVAGTAGVLYPQG